METSTGVRQEAFSKIKDRTDVGVGWLVGPPQKKKEPTPFFCENIKALEYSAAEEPRRGNRGTFRCG